MIRNSILLAAAVLAACDTGNASLGADLHASHAGDPPDPSAPPLFGNLSGATAQPPVDNGFVAPGCERFGEGLDEAMTPAEQSRVRAAIQLAQQQAAEQQPEESDLDRPERAAHQQAQGLVGVQLGQPSVQSPQRVPRPSLGRIVHYVPPHIRGNNPPSPLPAIITRVLSATCVNLRVFHDDERVPEHVTSVDHASLANDGRFWFWPVTV
jgi:hypothetical protein